MEGGPKVTIVIEEPNDKEKISLGEKRSSYRQKWAPFRRGRASSIYGRVDFFENFTWFISLRHLKLIKIDNNSDFPETEQEANSHDEIDSLDLFYERIKKQKENHPLAPLNFDGWTFLNVNFSTVDKTVSRPYN